MDIADILYPALFNGVLISVVMSAIVFITIRWNPEMWMHDAPPQIRERYGPVSTRSKREGQLVAIPVFIALGGILTYAILNLYQRAGGPPGFWAVFWTLFVAMEAFNLFDLLVLDWLIFATLKPRALMIPGTEEWEGWSDYGFYWRGFLKGSIGITIVSAALAGRTALIGIVAA